MKKTLLVLLAVLALAVPRVHAGDLQDVERDIEAIRKDIGEIKSVLISVLPVLMKGERVDVPSPAPPQGADIRQEATVSVDDDPVLGSASAGLVLVEFSDYECPFCARFYLDTLKRIKEEYIDKGKLRFVYRDFPLPFHQHAMKAAVAANCAGEQGKYWEMHDAIFENQAGIADLGSIAEKAGLDTGLFRECMSSNKYEDEVIKDLSDGREIGVGGTPTFVLGRPLEDGRVIGEVISGAMPYGAFKSRIDSLLE